MSHFNVTIRMISYFGGFAFQSQRVPAVSRAMRCLNLAATAAAAAAAFDAAAAASTPTITWTFQSQCELCARALTVPIFDSTPRSSTRMPAQRGSGFAPFCTTYRRNFCACLSSCSPSMITKQKVRYEYTCLRISHECSIYHRQQKRLTLRVQKFLGEKLSVEPRRIFSISGSS